MREFTWNRPQTRFLLTRAIAGGETEYVDLEGAVRAGKSTPAAAKLATYAVEQPGIHLAATRWSQDGLDAQVKPLWRDMASHLGLRLRWNAREEYDEVLPYRSRVYLRALKSSEETSRYAKLAGVTLACLWIDQPEEVPEDVFAAFVPARLSQVGYPHECWLTPNPPGEMHWIAKLFTDHGLGRPHHTYIRTSVYDNRHNLGESYIADLEAAYPPGSALRRRFVDGRRGLSAVGEAVYAGYFARDLHENERLEMNREVALLEAWDFGHRHPCVAWGQFLPDGALHVLGGVMGESMFLEDFAPVALQIQQEWFPQPLEIRVTGDPAGTAMNSQGTSRSAADVLQQFGRSLHVVQGANHPNKRNTAIQAIAGYMRRLVAGGRPAFQVHPQFLVVGKGSRRTMPVLVDGLEAGYVWSAHAPGGVSPNTRQPKKDGFYDHGQNCIEYLALMFGPALEPAKEPELRPTTEYVLGLPQHGWMR